MSTGHRATMALLTAVVVAAAGLFGASVFAQQDMRNEQHNDMRTDQQPDGTRTDQQPNTQNTVPGKMNNAMNTNMAAPDREFLNDAAMGGMTEVQLGRLAVDRASDPDVKQFGQRMVDDHSKANDQLHQLAQEKNYTLPTTLDKKHQQMIDKLSKLNGAEFDREYMSMMVKDHDKDVATFRKQSEKAKDSDVRSWAAKTLPTLEEHQRMAHDIAGMPMKNIKSGM